MFVMVAGLPRTGTTVVASFLNSIEGATIWGEPHRSKGVSGDMPMRSRYGETHFRPRGNVVDQIESFADMNNLWLYGLKEVEDPHLGVSPMEIASEQGDRLDLVFVMIRNPRKTWTSLDAIGHSRGLGWSVDIFADEYIKFANFSLNNNKTVPVIMSAFLRSPVVYMQGKLGLEIAGGLRLLQYTGGGDPHTTPLGSVIRGSDNRLEYDGEELDEAEELYRRIISEENSGV